jgi:hypothetical protein
MRLPFLTILIAGFCMPCALAAAVSHPNLLLNRDRPSQDIVLQFMTKAEWEALSQP